MAERYRPPHWDYEIYINAYTCLDFQTHFHACVRNVEAARIPKSGETRVRRDELCSGAQLSWVGLGWVGLGEGEEFAPSIAHLVEDVRTVFVPCRCLSPTRNPCDRPIDSPLLKCIQGQSNTPSWLPQTASDARNSHKAHGFPAKSQLIIPPQIRSPK